MIGLINERNSPLFNFNELFIWCLFLAFTGLRDAWNKWRQFWCVKRSLKWFNFYFLGYIFIPTCMFHGEGEMKFIAVKYFLKPFSLSFARSINYWILCIFPPVLLKRIIKSAFEVHWTSHSVSITTITSFIKRQQIFPLLFIVIIIIKLNDYYLFIQIIPPCFHLFHTHKNCESNYYLFGIYWHCFNSLFCQIIVVRRRLLIFIVEMLNDVNDTNNFFVFAKRSRNAYDKSFHNIFLI